MTIIWILISVLLGAVGQIYFKLAVTGRGSLSMIQAVSVSILSWHFWVGLIAYGLSLALWMKILTDADLSYARPFAGAGYIVTAVLAMIYLDESISLIRWFGIALIVLGVFLVAKN